MVSGVIVRTHPRLLAAIVAALALAMAPAGAAAHSSGDLGVRGLSEKKLRRFEIRTLGRAHAADHARERRAVRRARARRRAHRRRCRALRRRVRRGGAHVAKLRRQLRRKCGRRHRRRRRRGAHARLAAGPESGVGKWAAPFSIPVLGIHAALLPTG
jgi:hypothetical protein